MFSDHRRSRDWIAPLILNGFVWFAVFRVVWGDWRIDPQYSYGMVVPLLMLGLLLKRIPDRPEPGLLLPNRQDAASWLLIAGCLILSLTIPVAEANPDWRPVGLLASLMAVGITLDTLYLTGGKAWLRHFAFPVCFFLVAVPWPRNFEQSVMWGLMSWNASATLEILHWFGYEAVRQGNMIVIPSGVLGVEEACSGFRSLQSGMMVSLFFGEMLRIGKWRRVLLVVMAVVAALAGNIIRSSLLAVVASREGISSVSSWHDPAGLLVLVVTFGTVALCAHFWRGPTVSTVMHGRSHGDNHRKPSSFRIFPSTALLLIVSLLGTEIWFRVHESGPSVPLHWSLHPRGAEGGASRVSIPEQTLKMLFYPEGFSERWLIGDNAGGQAFYFRWPPGRTSFQASAMHRPEVCLSNVGMKLVTSLQPHDYSSGGITIPFRAWLFRHKGVSVHVFQALLDEGGGNDPKFRELDETSRARMRAVLKGRRNCGQRMIEVACWNLPDEQSACAALDRYLSGALVADRIPGPHQERHAD